MSKPESHFFYSQRLRLHYVAWGDPAAPIVILIHGGRDHARSWDSIAESLAQSWRVIAPDLRGHGDSEWASNGQYPVAAYVYDLAQLIENLGAAQVSLVGHSRGGQMALRYAGVFPEKVRRLVAIEGLFQGHIRDPELGKLPIAQQLRIWIENQRELAGRTPRSYASVEEPLSRMMAENRRLSRDLALHLTQHGLKRNEDGGYSWKFDNYTRGWTPPELTVPQIEELWSNIQCRVLLVTGGHGAFPNPVETDQVKRFRAAESVVFENAGHWVHHDQPTQFVERLRLFLAD